MDVDASPALDFLCYEVNSRAQMLQRWRCIINRGQIQIALRCNACFLIVELDAHIDHRRDPSQG
jgi:hypothetical protein